jgi:hypothetical protein
MSDKKKPKPSKKKKRFNKGTSHPKALPKANPKANFQRKTPQGGQGRRG